MLDQTSVEPLVIKKKFMLKKKKNTEAKCSQVIPIFALQREPHALIMFAETLWSPAVACLQQG